MLYESFGMSCKILVVEDEIFVATEIEYLVAELGHNPIGIAADKASAFNLAPFADIALVDLNLRDGPTGTEIGRALAEQHGVTVLFMTANPSQLADGVPGTVGVISKPVGEDELRQVVSYAVAKRNSLAADVPPRLRVFQ